MPQRRPAPGSARRFWLIIIGMIAVALCIGYLAGGLLGGSVLPRIPFLYHTDASSKQPSEMALPPSHASPLAGMSRAQLEKEVGQLRQELDSRNRQLDDMRVQLKLMQSGSRTK